MCNKSMTRSSMEIMRPYLEKKDIAEDYFPIGFMDIRQ